MTDRIDTPYCPDDVQGELGWIWDEDADALGEGGWRPCVTWLPDGKDAEPQIRLLSLWGDGESDEQRPADEWAGTPYLSASEPPCAPGAPLMVAIRLENGASATFTWERNAAPAEVDGIREAVLDVCRSDTYAYRRQLQEATEMCRDQLYARLRADVESLVVWRDGSPDISTLEDDARPWVIGTARAIRAAENTVGRAIPDGSPDWLPAAIDQLARMEPEAVS